MVDEIANKNTPTNRGVKRCHNQATKRSSEKRISASNNARRNSIIEVAQRKEIMQMSRTTLQNNPHQATLPFQYPKLSNRMGGMDQISPFQCCLDIAGCSLDGIQRRKPHPQIQPCSKVIRSPGVKDLVFLPSRIVGEQFLEPLMPFLLLAPLGNHW